MPAATAPPLPRQGRPARSAPAALRWLLCALALALSPAALGGDCPLPDAESAPTAALASVIDGDTVELDDGSLVRLLGINTPEIDHDNPDGAESLPGVLARRALVGKIGGATTLRIRLGAQAEDAHGRTLAYLGLADGTNLSAHLVKAGVAFVASIDPNTVLSECLLALERRAEDAARGLWKDPSRWVRDIDAAGATRGFAIVRARPTGFHRGKKGTWIDFGKRFSVRVSQETRRKYPQLDYPSLAALRRHLGSAQMEVRGWAYHARNKARMNLDNPWATRPYTPPAAPKPPR